MSTQSITTDIKRHFTWSIFTGVITALLGLFLIAYPLFATAITAAPVRGGIDCRRNSAVCLCAALALAREISSESYSERALSQPPV